MHRKIVSRLLLIHLLLMMLVLSFNSLHFHRHEGMIIVGILASYVVLLFIHLRTKAVIVGGFQVNALVVLGSLLYSVVNAAAFLFFVSRSSVSLKQGDVWVLSLFFLPGLYCSFAYFLFLVRDPEMRGTE